MGAAAFQASIHLVIETEKFGRGVADMNRRRRRRRQILRKILICVAAAGILFLAGAGTARLVRGLEGNSPLSAPSSEIARASEAPPGSSSGAPPAPSSAAPPVVSKPPAEVSGPPPESMVEKSWFDDAVFIGDSRTEGLALYDGLGGASYYTLKGLMVSTVETKPAVEIGGRKVSVMQALRMEKFGKVYVMLGVNELGWSSSQTFVEDYGKLVDDLKKNQPGARIYLQSILPVTAEKSASSTIYNNTKIESYNKAIRKIADEKGVRYLAVSSAVSDRSGCLPPEASTDGVHLNAKYCGKWCEYLRSHTGTEKQGE